MSEISSAHRLIYAIDAHIQDLQNDVKSRIDMLQSVRKQISSSLGETPSLNSELVDASASDVAIKRADVADPSTTGASHFGIECSSSQQLRSSLNGNNELELEAVEASKPRCLLVSDGLVVCCLDLKQRKSCGSLRCEADVPFLPKMATLKLLEEKRFPVAVGVFKLGCDATAAAYMIGGQYLSGYCPVIVEVVTDYPTPLGLNPSWSIKLYKFLALNLRHGGINDNGASSHDTYLLSSKATDAATLSLSSSACNIPALNKPKIWPIVEVIGGLVHVMASIPKEFLSYRTNLKASFTHEVLNTDDLGKGWTEIPTADECGDVLIFGLLVVGDHIYASAYPPV